MMLACYCTWVEKRITLRQSAKEFEQDMDFLNTMTSYYRAKGYVHKDTFIGYKSDYMEFQYDHSKRLFTHRWGKKRWNYRRPKVSYVPAERNMVSLVSNWSRLETNYVNILDFKEDWDTARQYVKREHDILGMGISYEYDELSGIDSVITSSGKKVDLTSSSSGIQSLIPQFVHLDYLTKGIYKVEKNVGEKTYSGKQLVNILLDALYQRNYEKQKVKEDAQKTVIHLEGNDYVFTDGKAADSFKKEASRLLYTDHAEIFLEEPESNLFPPTQFQLMDWVLERATDKRHKNTFFIATHSPYILNYLLQENLKDFKLFLTYPVKGGLYKVKTTSDEDIQGIYDNGSDAFFNFEPFTVQ